MMSLLASNVATNAAIAAGSFGWRSTSAAPSRATSTQRLPISTPITLLPSIPTSIMLVGSGPSTRLYAGVAPSTVRVPDRRKKPAGVQISTVVETFRDLEVPPALPFCRGRDQHTIRDRDKLRAGRGPGFCTVPVLQRI